MKRLLLLAVMLIVSLSLFAAFNPEYSDYLFYNKKDFEGDIAYLQKELDQATSNDERAVILWRIARYKFTVTDEIDDDKEFKEIKLAGFQEAEKYALDSLALLETPNGYHWLSSAIGKMGKVNGPLNSLSKAKPMREYAEKVQNYFNADMSDSWYALSLLYNQLPGSPLSFGNKDYAISYIKRCLETQDNVNRNNLANYLELAEQLVDRNWSKSKRAKEFDKMKTQYDKQSVPTEKMKYFEGVNGQNTKPFYSSVPLGQISDKQEALMVLRYALAFYEKTVNKFPSDADKLEDIYDLIDDLT